MSSSMFFNDAHYLICYFQLKETGSKLTKKVWRFFLAKALPFTFHSNANGPFMQKEKIIVWQDSRFQEKQTCFKFRFFFFVYFHLFRSFMLLYQKQNRFVQNVSDVYVDTRLYRVKTC